MEARQPPSHLHLWQFAQIQNTKEAKAASQVCEDAEISKDLRLVCPEQQPQTVVLVPAGMHGWSELLHSPLTPRPWQSV